MIIKILSILLMTLPLAFAKDFNQPNIATKYQTCKTASDCIQVGSDCAGCCKYEAINKALKSQYEDEHRKYCKSYKGSVCECCAADYRPDCRDSKCVLDEVPGTLKAKCGS